MSDRKVIVTIAPTGGTLGKDRNSALPTQPNEIADDVFLCWQSGAAVAALHARRPDDQATCNPEIYRRINDLIRSRCDIVINNSTGGGTNGDMVQELPDGRKEISFEERLKAIGAGAELCTFGPQTSSISTFGAEILMDTSWSRCQRLAGQLAAHNIKPEWEVYSHADLLLVGRLLSMGYDEPPYCINLVLGTEKYLTGTLPYTPRILQSLVDDLPVGSVFSVSVFGRQHLPATTHGLLLGGHVRVGLEDTLYYAEGDRATNERLVQRAVRLITELGMEIATPSDARAMLGLKEPQGSLQGRP